MTEQPDPAEYADPLPREVVRILAHAAQARANEIEDALFHHDYEEPRVAEQEKADIERALRYVPEALRPGSGDVAQPSGPLGVTSAGEILFLGGDGVALRDANGLEAGRLREASLVLTETEWKVVAGVIGALANAEHEAAPRIVAEMIGQPEDVVLALMRKVFAPVLAPVLTAPETPRPDLWHVGELPGDDGTVIRDENGLEVPATDAIIAAQEAGWSVERLMGPPTLRNSTAHPVFRLRRPPTGLHTLGEDVGRHFTAPRAAWVTAAVIHHNEG